jgi:TonB-linked SusC/RagA family outer membrane protein
MRKILVYITILCTLGVYSVQAQNLRISGIVMDNNGPLPGVSVKEKGVTSNGVATDSDGKFSMVLGTGSTIIVSGVGYFTKEINVAGNTNLSIVIEADTKGLDEVIVVGYGTQKKITLTGAASMVSGKELRKNPTASLQNTMIGVLPGFVSQQKLGTPGGDGADFYIRGQSSYAGTNQPLIIVDDVEFSYAQFSTLSANEIESVTILKDASTTAQYGIKGANGVVVVTTRRGKVGKPSISFTSEYALNQSTIMPKFLNSYQVASLYNQAQINDNIYAPNPNFVPKFTDNDLALYQSGSDPYGHPDVNWTDVLFKKFARQTRNNFDISGGTERVKYFISLGYLDQGGILKDFSDGQGVDGNFYHQRYNYRSNLDINVNRTLDLSINVSGSNYATNNPNVGGAFGAIFTEITTFKQLAPFAYPVYNPNGSLGYSTLQQTFFGSAYNTNNVVGRLTYDGYTRTYGNNMNLNAVANQKLNSITQGLTLKGVLAYGNTYSYTRSMTRPANFPSYIYSPTADTYTPRDPAQLTLPRFGVGYSGGSTIRVLTLQANLNYDRTFGPNHFTGLILFSQNSNVGANSNVDYNFVPNASRGLTARLGYDYKQKYLLQISGAYNGTSRFVADKQYGLFPAVSGGWNIAEESFVKRHAKFLDLLKLRASYGLVGSDQLPSGALYSYNQTYTAANGIGNYPGSFGTIDDPYTGIQEGTLANANVTWEKVKKFDLGIDFSLLSQKISGTFDYFNDDRYDILTTRADVSAIFGQTLPPVNLGKVNNRGFEAELNYRDKIGKDFNYSLRATYTYAKNTIIYKGEPIQQYQWQATTGKSIGATALYQFLGFYQSQEDITNSPKTPSVAIPGDLKYADLNGDGLINGFDAAVSNYTTFPRSVYSFQPGISYKGLSLNVMFQAASQFLQYGTNQQIVAFVGNLQPVHLQAWTPQLGNAAKYPVLKVSGPGFDDPAVYPSTFWSKSGEYIRLKTADLSYSFPDKFIKKLHLQNAKIYFSGINLITWSPAHYDLYQSDPEFGQSGVYNYPPQRTYNVGLNVTF